MAIGDAAYIKNMNRSSIISKIIEKEHISRAELAAQTNLTRATISVQVADLLEESLIIETQIEHNSVGRKPIMLSLNGDAGYALGIDLDFEGITFIITNLLGKPIHSYTIAFNSTDYSKILNKLITEISKLKLTYSKNSYGIIGIVVGIHGLVETSGLIHYVPIFQWNNVDLKGDLEKEFDTNIYIENNANLSSYAERVFYHHQSKNLLSINLHMGVGIGIVANNEFFYGYDGFAGEAGHMIIEPSGLPCTCGNKGCWGQYVSDKSIIKQLSKTKGTQNLNLKEIQNLINEDDPDVQEKIEKFIYYLTIGLNNIINLYNPEVLVLDSELLQIVPNASERIKDYLNSSISPYHEILISKLGKKSCGMGACALAIKNFLDVPLLNLK